MSTQKKAREYFLVNPSGTIHGVTREHGQIRIQNDPRYRWATKEEIAAYKKAKGKQTTKKRLAQPYSIDPPEFDDDGEETETATTGKAEK